MLLLILGSIAIAEPYSATHFYDTPPAIVLQRFGYTPADIPKLAETLRTSLWKEDYGTTDTLNMLYTLRWTGMGPELCRFIAQAKSPAFRLTAISYAWQLNAKCAGDFARELALSPKTDVSLRRGATIVLPSLLERTDALQVLGALLNDAYTPVAIAASMGLGRLGDQRGLEVAIKGMTAKSLVTRMLAYRALGAIGGREARAALMARDRELEANGGSSASGAASGSIGTAQQEQFEIFDAYRRTLFQDLPPDQKLGFLSDELVCEEQWVGGELLRRGQEGDAAALEILHAAYLNEQSAGISDGPWGRMARGSGLALQWDQARP
jgi:hypothetical protein